MLNKNKQLNLIKKIMNENLETISYSITFLSNLYPKNKGEIVTVTDQHNLFKDIANTFTLQLLLESYDKESQIEVTENTKDSFPNKEFAGSNGLKFTFEQPFKLTISYSKIKGNIDNPDKYIKELSNIIAIKAGKSKIGAVGVNYEIFYPDNEPENIIITNLVNQLEKDDSIEKGLVKLVYKIDQYTNLNLSITSATYEDKNGLYFSINFHSDIKGSNKVSEILNREDLIEIASSKINKLIKLG